MRRRASRNQNSNLFAAALKSKHTEIQCNNHFLPSPTVSMSDGVDYYLHPEENVYVCRGCLKRFKLRVMVKVHQCQRTHCTKCQQLVASCNCHSDSLQSASNDFSLLEDTAQCGDESDVLVSPETVSSCSTPSQNQGSFLKENPHICVIEQLIHCRPGASGLWNLESSPPAPMPTIGNTFSLAALTDDSQNIPSSVNKEQEGNKNIMSPLSEECDNQHESSYSTSRTASLPSNYDVDDDRTTMSALSANSLLSGVHNVVEGDRSETSASEDGVDDQKLLSCHQCLFSFSSEHSLTEHTKLVHSQQFTSSQIQINSTENYLPAPITSLLANDSYPFSQNNFIPIHQSVSPNVQPCTPLQNLSDDIDVESLSQMSTAIAQVAEAKSINCSTCQITFSSPSSYSEHKASCFRVWSKATVRGWTVPVKTYSKRPAETYSKRPLLVPPFIKTVTGRTVSVYNERSSFIPSKHKQHNDCRSNSNALNNKTKFKVVGMDNRVIHIIKAKESSDLKNSSHTETKQCNLNGDNVNSDVKMEPHNDIMDISLNIEDDNLDIKDVTLIKDAPSLLLDSEVTFPQPIAVNAVKSECLLESEVAVRVMSERSLDPEVGVQVKSECLLGPEVAVQVKSECWLEPAVVVQVKVEREPEPQQERGWRRRRAPPAPPAPAAAAPAREPRATAAAPAREPRATAAAPAREPRATAAAPAREPRATAAAPAREPRATAAAPPAAHTQQQLRQLTMLPTVTLTRCDALLSPRAAEALNARVFSNALRAAYTECVSRQVLPSGHRCGDCALWFPSRLQLGAHRRSHGAQCPLCLTALASRAARARHGLAHVALVTHIVGAPPGPGHRASRRFVGLPPDAILPYLDRG